MNERREPSKIRTGKITKFRVGEAKGWLTTGEYEDGTLAEVFLKMSKFGSTMNGMCAWIGVSISRALQHGVPLIDLASVPIHELRFEPYNETDDPEIPTVISIADYVMRRLVLDYCTEMEQSTIGVKRAT